MYFRITASAALFLSAVPFSAIDAQDISVLTTDDPLTEWRTVTYPGGVTASFSVGLGSGAYRHPDDPDNQIYVVSDRGPNFTCKAAKKLIGEDSQPSCSDIKRSRFYPTPDYTPSIYRLALEPENGSFRVMDVIAIKTASGHPSSGMLNPQTVSVTDTAIDLSGNILPTSPDAVDLEGIIKLSDGSFWLGDEMGPSVLHVSADGRMLKRFVPEDAAADYAKADTRIVATLPAILSKRTPNRGIESMAVSPDEKHLYFMLQNPLSNPDSDTYKAAKNTRVFKMDRETGELVGEYVYQLDDPRNFGFDDTDAQNAPRVSELTALSEDRLLVLERTNKTTKLFEVSLGEASNILGSEWDDVATSPSLETLNDLSSTGVTPLSKTLAFDTFEHFKDAPTKIEGVAFLGDGTMALINDNDFGITGEPTKVVLVKGVVSPDEQVFAAR